MPLSKSDLGLDYRPQGTEEQRNAYLEIERLMEEAANLMANARRLAEEHDLTFTVELPTGMDQGSVVNGGDAGWQGSYNRNC